MKMIGVRAMLRLVKKVAIITRAGSGIGKATAVRFGKEGATVVVADYNYQLASEVSDELVQQGYEGTAYQVDVSRSESVENLVKEMASQYGRIDILINNAGITRDAMLHKMTLDQWNAVIATNLTGVYLMGQAVGKIMREQGFGRIINTSSVVGVYGNIGQSN
jgi:3-oxoacyl-[acyl-carrier protein] reductase